MYLSFILPSLTHEFSSKLGSDLHVQSLGITIALDAYGKVYSFAIFAGSEKAEQSLFNIAEESKSNTLGYCKNLYAFLLKAAWLSNSR